MPREIIRYGFPGLIVLIVVTFGILVYPSLYYYDKLDQKYPVRINRFTGETKMLSAYGWLELKDYQPTTNETSMPAENLSAEDKSSSTDKQLNERTIVSQVVDLGEKEFKLGELNFTITGYKLSMLRGNIYNNTDKPVKIDSLEVKAKDSNKNAVSIESNRVNFGASVLSMSKINNTLMPGQYISYSVLLSAGSNSVVNESEFTLTYELPEQ